MKLVTHDGEFHADDVCAVAVLKTLFPEIEVTRTRDEELIADADIVVDVGGTYDPGTQRFDHHQRDGSGERTNGIPYASIGLVWKHYGVQFCDGSIDVAEWIDKKVIQAIDATDTGITLFDTRYDCGIPTINSLVRLHLPTWREEMNDTVWNSRFSNLVPLVQIIFERLKENGFANFEAITLVEEAIACSSRKETAELSKKVPWYDVAINHPDLLYVLIPDPKVNGRWRAYATRVQADKFETRKPFPETWAGLINEELAEVTGVADALFCHRARHLVVADSYQGIQTLVELALQS